MNATIAPCFMSSNFIIFIYRIDTAAIFSIDFIIGSLSTTINPLLFLSILNCVTPCRQLHEVIIAHTNHNIILLSITALLVWILACNQRIHYFLTKTQWYYHQLGSIKCSLCWHRALLMVKLIDGIARFLYLSIQF